MKRIISMITWLIPTATFVDTSLIYSFKRLIKTLFGTADCPNTFYWKLNIYSILHQIYNIHLLILVFYIFVHDWSTTDVWSTTGKSPYINYSLILF